VQVRIPPFISASTEQNRGGEERRKKGKRGKKKLKALGPNGYLNGRPQEEVGGRKRRREARIGKKGNGRAALPFWKGGIKKGDKWAERSRR